MAIARQPTRSSTLAARIASARCSPVVRSTSKRMSEVNSIGGLADPIASPSQGSRTGLQAQGPPAASASLWRFALVVHGNTDGLEATFRLLSDGKQTSRCIAKPSRLTRNGSGLQHAFTDNLALWHPGDTHTLMDALPTGKINGVVTRYGSAIAAYRKGRVERKSGLGGGPRLTLRSEQPQGRGEMEMAAGIIVVGFEAPAQPSDRFSICTQLQLGEADPHHPIAGIGIAGR